MAKDGGKNSAEAFAKEIRSALADLKSGDSSTVDATLTHLIERQQDRIAELSSELDTVRGKLPAEDAVVLTADEAKTLEAYRALGKPEEITKKIESGDEAAKKLADRESSESWEKAATAHGYKPTVLGPLAKKDGLAVVEMKTVQPEEGDALEVAIVRQGEKGESTRLDDYAKEHWSDFLPALTAEDGSDESGAQPTGTGRKTPYPRQQARGGGKKSLTLEERKKAKVAAGAMAHF